MESVVPRWFKSSRSAAETCCVEVSLTPPSIRVRDSAHPDGRVIGVTTLEWTALLRTVFGT